MGGHMPNVPQGSGSSPIIMVVVTANNLPAVAYIHTNSVVAKLAEIEASGGKRLAEPMSISGMATFGYFQDSSESRMGLIGP